MGIFSRSKHLEVDQELSEELANGRSRTDDLKRPPPPPPGAGSSIGAMRVGNRTSDLIAGAQGNVVSGPYGIQQVIELMRKLPNRNLELVVQVVKRTLESVSVSIPTLINDATQREKDIFGRVENLKKDIANLESEVSAKRKTITELEADHKEVTTVKERLALALKLEAATLSEPPPITGSGRPRVADAPGGDVAGTSTGDLTPSGRANKSVPPTVPQGDASKA
jgi:hypothetical protein